MRIVLDTAILVRAHDGAKGLARELPLKVTESAHVLLIPDEVRFLRETTEIVRPNPLLITPIRDVNDTVVMKTAIIGEANVLCTRDQDFFDPPAEPFLRKAGIAVLDDITLMQRLRT